MNTWRYVEFLVLPLRADDEGGFVSIQENCNSYRVDQGYKYAMAWEEVQKIACSTCSLLPPRLIFEKTLPLALQHELSKIQ